uniref:Uncharacterized protein n=1 Tax=Zooxanthella nutricula TaxID=1333877 RepID=A0A7S2N7X0_9DINO
MNDPGQGGFDRETRELWNMPEVSGKGGRGMPNQHSQPPTPQGGKGMAAGSGCGASPAGRNKAQQHQVPKWMPVNPEQAPNPAIGKGQGKGQGQQGWTPKAAAIVPQMSVPVPAPAPMSPKGGGKARKKASTAGDGLDDWLSQRMGAGAPAPAAAGGGHGDFGMAGQAEDWGGDYGGGFDDDYAGEEGGGRRSGKKRGGKAGGGGGKGGKGGKGKGGKWRASG